MARPRGAGHRVLSRASGAPPATSRPRRAGPWAATRTAKLRALALGVIALAHPAWAQDGEQIFKAGATPPCGVCHALAAAGTAGGVGPDLDRMRPTRERVRAAVEGGPGTMPAYDGLTDAQIEAVARYVADVAGNGAARSGR